MLLHSKAKQINLHLLAVDDNATVPYQSASVAATANKIVSRDSAGNMAANVITGTATQA